MWIIKRRNHLAKIEPYLLLSIQVSNDTPGNGERVRIIHGVVVGNARIRVYALPHRQVLLPKPLRLSLL